MNLFRIFILLVVIARPLDIAAEDSELSVDQFVDRVLSSVISANRYYSYTGLLTYEAGGSLSTLRLRQKIKTVDDSYRAYQELEFLDGVSRRVIRDQSLAQCQKGQTRWGLWPDQFDTQILRQHYDVNLYGLERVANRSTVLVGLSSKDNLRYEHRFNIDQQTGLILRSAVLEKGSIIERTQFVSVEFSEENAQPVLDEKQSLLWRVPEIEPCQSNQFTSVWRVTWLPDGFISAGNRVTAKGEQVLMFTDGLVSVSVFITENQLNSIPNLTARRGATVAVIVPLADQAESVAVVGEVPVTVARRMAVSVKPE